jgi:hypothetical protein
VFYVGAKANIVDFLTTEFDEFPVKLQNRFLNFFPLLSNYTEEGNRYHPSILFTDSIDLLIKNLPNPYKIEMFNDENEYRFDSRLRALIPFCRFEWTIFVNINDNGRIQYGLLSNVGSIKDKNLEELLFKNAALTEKIGAKASAILVYANTRWTVTMKSLKGNALHTNFALDIMGHSNMDNEVAALVDASFSKLKTTVKKMDELKTMLNNMLKNVMREVHGTICVVVDHDTFNRDELLKDGVWLESPVNLSKLFMQSNHYHEHKLTATANLFLTMLNKDGITILDNAGNILAYNVFVEINLKDVVNIIGGARKRAAYTIINSRRRDIIGVYFQSYDGELFFANVKK